MLSTNYGKFVIDLIFVCETIHTQVFLSIKLSLFAYYGFTTIVHRLWYT